MTPEFALLSSLILPPFFLMSFVSLYASHKERQRIVKERVRIQRLHALARGLRRPLRRQ